MLQVIKAEEVRDGEPRWWCPDDVYAARTLEWIVTGNLHTEWHREADAFTLAIVDRHASTPTVTPGVDLEAVERDIDEHDDHSLADKVSGPVVRIVEVHAPALIAEVRALRAQVCRLVSGQAIESDALCQHHDADLAALAEVASLREKLAEAKRLGREACQVADGLLVGGTAGFHDAITAERGRVAAIAAALEAL